MAQVGWFIRLTHYRQHCLSTVTLLEPTPRSPETPLTHTSPCPRDCLLPAAHSPLPSTSSLRHLLLPPDPHANMDPLPLTSRSTFSYFLYAILVSRLSTISSRDEWFARPLQVTYHTAFLPVGSLKSLQMLVRDL